MQRFPTTTLPFESNNDVRSFAFATQPRRRRTRSPGIGVLGGIASFEAPMSQGKSRPCNCSSMAQRADVENLCRQVPPNIERIVGVIPRVRRPLSRRRPSWTSSSDLRHRVLWAVGRRRDRFPRSPPTPSLGRRMRFRSVPPATAGWRPTRKPLSSSAIAAGSYSIENHLNEKIDLHRCSRRHRQFREVYVVGDEAIVQLFFNDTMCRYCGPSSGGRDSKPRVIQMMVHIQTPSHLLRMHADLDVLDRGLARNSACVLCYRHRAVVGAEIDDLAAGRAPPQLRERRRMRRESPDDLGTWSVFPPNPEVVDRRFDLGPRQFDRIRSGVYIEVGMAP